MGKVTLKNVYRGHSLHVKRGNCRGNGHSDNPAQYKRAALGEQVLSVCLNPCGKERPPWDSKKSIGMDGRKETISIAGMNAAGKGVMEGVIETKASMILQFVQG